MHALVLGLHLRDFGRFLIVVKPGRNRVGAGRSERGSTMTDRVQQRSEEMMTASEVVDIQ